MDPLNYRNRPPSAAEQLDGCSLFEQLPEKPNDPAWLTAPVSPIEHAFQGFHAKNPHVYAELERRALAAMARGDRRLGVAKLVEDIRHDPQLRTTSDDFKLNNNFRALYARLLIHRRPQLEALLATRERREKGGAAA